MLDDWLRSHEVFGKPSYPAHCCYVACEQPVASLRRDIRRLGMNQEDLPHFSLTRWAEEKRTLELAYTTARRNVPPLKVLILDGMQTLCPGRISDSRDSSKFLLNATKLCEEQDITIIGCASTCKAKEGEGYLSPFDRIPGSFFWTTIPLSKIVIESARPSKPSDPSRTVYLASRGVFLKQYQYAIENDRFIYRGEGECLVQPDLDAWLSQQEEDSQITTQQVLQLGEILGVSRRSAFNWIANQLQLGTLEKVDRGHYRVKKNKPPM